MNTTTMAAPHRGPPLPPVLSSEFQPTNDATPPPPLTMPTSLPKSLLKQDPVLLRRTHLHFWACVGLEQSDRAVLGAVLQQMPAPLTTARPTAIGIDPTTPTSVIDRILALPVQQLNILAHLFTVGLTSSRAWGGGSRRPKSSFGSSGETPFSIDSPSPAGPPKHDPILLYQAVLSALDIPVLPSLPAREPERPAVRPHRSSAQSDNCLERHLRTCPIPFSESVLDHAHVLPYSVTSLDSSAATPFWMVGV